MIEGTIADLIQAFFTKLFQVAQNIFEAIFGDIDFAVLWTWCPADIRIAAAFFVLVLFILAILKFIRSILPF